VNARPIRDWAFFVIADPGLGTFRNVLAGPDAATHPRSILRNIKYRERWAFLG
jgi:hypothetical protein